jgi:glycosyltransferase involved in cell wall biosynthesis
MNECGHKVLIVVTVLIDLRMVRGALHGIARYALELARRLPVLEPAWRFVGLTSPQGLPDGLGSLTPRIELVKSSADFLSPVEQPALLATLLQHRPSLFHATSFSLPALWPGRLVATLHDATHLALPENASAIKRGYYNVVVAPRAKRAEALITVSAFSRKEIATHLALPEERLQVIANGVDSAFTSTPEAELIDFRERRGVPQRYVAAIGNPKPHKNMQVLVPIATQLPAPLVLLAGRGTRRALGFAESVVELAPLPDDDLVRLYSGATAVLAPSRYEGFGLPILEAMACGAPVIAADAGAHAEVLGDAGLLVPPSEPTAWLTATQRLANDPTLRRTLSEKGRERASRFTWEACAQQTLTVYRRALSK